MISFESFFTLWIPVGFGLLALLGSLRAHRGYPTRGTWTVLISALFYLFFFSAYRFFDIIESLFQPSFDNTIFGILTLLSIYSLSFGAFLMTSHWRILSRETALLEKRALQLAAEREELEARAGLPLRDEPLPSFHPSDSLNL